MALIMGFRSNAGILAWLGVIGILVLLTLAFTWVAVVSGLLGKTIEGSTAMSYPMLFLPFISSSFVPVETMPAAVAAFAKNQPMTPIAETLRALLTGAPVENDIWIALAWCLGILLVAWFLAMRIYKRRILGQ
jgi:ABC-2 type transport system permease protein